MSELEKRAIAEWWRQYRIYELAKKDRIEGVLLACLASMNTLARVLGYEPDSVKSSDVQ
jgi:hypothetical protein